MNEKLKQISEALGNKPLTEKAKKRQVRQKRREEKAIQAAKDSKNQKMPGPVYVSKRTAVVESVVERVVVERVVLPAPSGDDVERLKKENERLNTLNDRLEDQIDRYFNKYGPL